MNNNYQYQVSVAVITYNMERYLTQLLDSILKQEVDFSYEIVIDDDCSPDQSRRIIREYAEKYPEIIHPIYRNENVGGSKNMYGVLRFCRGKYIAILEGDDWWESKNKLQYQYDFMEQNIQYIGMYCNSWCELSTKEVKRIPRRDISEPMIFTYDNWKSSYSFKDRLPNSTDTAFFRNIFNSGIEKELSVLYKAHRMVWDQSLALILFGKGTVYVDPMIVSHHRTIVEEDGTNYQSLYAKQDNKVTDAAMYAAHEEYIENVLSKPCGKFYRVRGMLFAEAFWIYLKERNSENKEKMLSIWKQRKRKRALIFCTWIWGCKTLKRKVLG